MRSSVLVQPEKIILQYVSLNYEVFLFERVAFEPLVTSFCLLDISEEGVNLRRNATGLEVCRGFVCMGSWYILWSIKHKIISSKLLSAQWADSVGILFGCGKGFLKENKTTRADEVAARCVMTVTQFVHENVTR